MTRYNWPSWDIITNCYLAKKKLNDYGTGIPLHEVEALARVLLPEIQKFFESEEGQWEFQEWKQNQRVQTGP